MTNVPQPTFGPTGFSAPLESAIVAGVLADYNAAFGGNLNLAQTTPQGQLSVSQAAVIGNSNDQFLYFTNQVDPAYASGRMQDAIARIYFLQRKPALPTTVTVTCKGLTGTIIPPGALALSTDDNIYVCTDGGTIPLGGTINLNFACTVTGPIACPVGALNGIYQTIPGWDSVYNPAEGVMGRDVESRADFEARRAASVAINAVGILPAIRATVLNVPDVLDAYVTENDTGSPATIGGVSIAAHSLYFAVSGGSDADVARAIWTKKNPGCGYTGNTTVTVVDDNAGYSLPYPEYDVTFTRPINLPIIFAVEIADGPNVPADAAAQIQTAIVNAFNGADGGPRASIGATLFASRFYAPIGALGPWAQIVSLVIGSYLPLDTLLTGSIAGTTLTVTAASGDPVVVGMTITGASGPLPGTKVIAFGTGSGGTGTYTVNKSQTLASQSLSGVVPDLDRITPRIDMIPTIDAADITVTLV